MHLNIPRTLIVSLRGVRPQVFQASTFEFEDIVQEIDQADLFDFRPALDRPSFIRHRAAKISRRLLGIEIQRVPATIARSVASNYDILIYRLMSPGDLSYLGGAQGWESCAKIKVAWIEELWPEMFRYTKMFKPFKQFDHIFVGQEQNVEPLSKLTGRPCSFLAPAVDALRYCPYPDPPARVIDFCSIGRRCERTHDALFENMQRNPGFNYFFDSARLAEFTRDHRQHRALSSGLINRSRFMLANRAKANEPLQTQGSHVFGPRFFEGAAGGAILIGEPSACAEFRAHFDWPVAMVPMAYDTADPMAIINAFEADPERVRRARKANILNSLRRHDWSHRWASILSTIGVDPLPGLAERQAQLEARAALVETEA